MNTGIAMQPMNNRAHYTNLNFIRISLALIVTWSHCYPLSGNAEPVGSILSSESGGSIAVKAFFFLSGILIAQSWINKPSAAQFIIARALRISPALLAALFLSIILAFLASTERSVIFLQAAFEYLVTNSILFFDIIYQLPGAYSSQPTNSVNGSLWTLPWEVRAYAGLLILGCLGVLNRAYVFNCFFFLLVFVIFSDAAYNFYDNKEVPWMLLAFSLGVLVVVNFPQRPYWYASIVFAFLGAISLFFSAKLSTLLFLCCLILVIGFSSKIRLPDVKNDISFGIYVYSFPIQQFLIFNFGSLNPNLFFVLSLIFVYPLALFSWTVIESKAIQQRAFFMKLLSVPKTAIIVSLIFFGLFLSYLSFKYLNKSNQNKDYYWGVYFPSQKILSLRSAFNSGFSDLEIKLNTLGQPIIGKWSGATVALGLFDSAQCKFTLYSTLSQDEILREKIFDCRETGGQPITGDWHGDGITRTGVYFPNSGIVLMEGKGEPDTEFFFGQPNSGLIMFAGDWNKDNIYTVGVWQARENRFDLLNKNQSSVADESFTVFSDSIQGDEVPFSVKLESNQSLVGLYSKELGTFTLYSPETRNVLLTVEYGAKNSDGVPIFLNK